MSEIVLTDWDQAKTDAFEKEVVLCRHNLHERPMFSDEGLAELLDRYPREKLGIYAFGDDPMGKEQTQAGTAEGLSGEQILEAVQKGRIWLNLRRTSDELPEYGALCKEMFADLERNMPGVRTFKQDVGVLISSPKVQVLYHLDIPLVTLWQLRGRKRIWLYPPRQPLLMDEELERVVLRESEEEVEYSHAFDEKAQIVDMEPGMMATWPQFGPHRIVNHDVLNVSLSCEFQTYMSILRANAVYANGVLRRNFGFSPDIAKSGAADLHIRAGFARLFKLLKLRKSFEYHKPRTFKIDPQAENGLCELKDAA